MTYKLKGPKSPIVSALDVFPEIAKKYPNRKVVSEPLCPTGTYYYFSTNGNIRRVMKDRTIWICDRDRGMPWMKCIRGEKKNLVLNDEE